MTDQVSLPSDPIEGFLLWLSEAEKANLHEPTAMTLATISQDLRPSARIVLYKGLSENALGERCPRFFTNYDGRKSQDLVSNPRAALVFHWGPLEKQLRIEGVAEKVSHEESEAYFKTRERKSQIGAWASPQSRTLKNRSELDSLVAAIEEKFKDAEIPCPPNWGGWRIVPERFEFWQGVRNRLHDRFVYSRKNPGWTITRLAP